MGSDTPASVLADERIDPEEQMTQHIRARFVDDLDENSLATRVVVFAWRNVDYSIDLNDAHASEFRQRMERFTSRARAVQRGLDKRN